MIESIIQRLKSQSYAVQILVIGVIFAPIGFGLGYLLGPSIGFSELEGGIIGLLTIHTSVIWFWVTRQAQASTSPT